MGIGSLLKAGKGGASFLLADFIFLSGQRFTVAETNSASLLSSPKGELPTTVKVLQTLETCVMRMGGGIFTSRNK